jgi:tetratricopeptide (TPR) repeat protein
MEDRAHLLSELLKIDLEDIAERCEGDKWQRIGLIFEATHHFVINYKQLQAKHLHANDVTLRRELFHDLAERGITIAELANALQDRQIGLNSVAEYLQATSFKKRTVPKATKNPTESSGLNYSSVPVPSRPNSTGHSSPPQKCTEEYGNIIRVPSPPGLSTNQSSLLRKHPESRKLPLFDTPRMRHEYQVPQDLSIILDEEQTLQLVHAELKKRNQIVIESHLAANITFDYWKWQQDFAVCLWLDVSNSDGEFVKQVYELADWFKISVREQIISLEDFAVSDLREKILQRIQLDKTLVIFNGCYSLEILRRAKLLHVPLGDSRVIIGATQLHGTRDEIFVFQPPPNLSCLNKQCNLFIRLLACVNVPVIPLTIFYNCSVFGEQKKIDGLKMALSSLSERNLIQFDTMDQIHVKPALAGCMKLSSSQKKEVIEQWISILASTNGTHNSRAHNTTKADLFRSLKPPESLEGKYAEALVEFLGFLKGEYYFNLSSNQLRNFPVHGMLIEALQNTYIQNKQRDNFRAVEKVVLQCEEFEGSYSKNFELIAKWCYAHYLREFKGNMTDTTVINECRNSLHFSTFKRDHPFFLKVQQSYALCLLENNLTIESENILSQCHETLKLQICGVEGDSALTETTTYLALAKYRRGDRKQAANLFEEALRNQLCGNELTQRILPFTPIIMAGLTEAILSVELRMSSKNEDLVVRKCRNELFGVGVTEFPFLGNVYEIRHSGGRENDVFMECRSKRLSISLICCRQNDQVSIVFAR